MDRNLFRELEAKLPDMTRAQKLVADFITKKPMNAVFFTIDQLAHASGASTATVVRLALFMGYGGYADFQRELQDCLQKMMAPSHRLEERFQDLGKNDLLSEVFMVQMKGLEETFANLNHDNLRKAVDLIQRGRRVYVVGSRSCFSVAHYLGYNLARITGKCRFLNPSEGLLGEELNQITDEDVVICFTLPRYITTVVRAAKIAASRGAHIIAITDGYRSPLASYSEVLLRIAYRSYDFHNTVMPAFLIAEILISLITAENPLSTKTNLAEVETILADLDTHVNVK
ncbi:MAG: MurR/RpiR family transcriptional regulator [Candidatus Adiutrix sp.]|jgi:DNA-binding MurR/RpiR family transcriptional regulator|nr:MurR/RpiR family transcriptional regulator [Candidatus Adiutrix sp.]